MLCLISNPSAMTFVKQIKDHLIKLLLGKSIVPRGLFELDQYFRLYGPIRFVHHKEKDATIAISQNFRYGSIVTSGKDEKELDANIKDAILTSFEVPSSYAKEAKIRKEGAEEVYALA